MAYVSYEYYHDEYGGLLVDETNFPSYEKAAERVINASIRFADFASMNEFMQTCVKDAVCAQIEYYGSVGLEASSIGVSKSSFTVGKVSITSEADKGANALTLAPAAKLALEQTGLLNRDIPVPVEPFTPVWW